MGESVYRFSLALDYTFLATFCFFVMRFTDASTSDNNFQTRFTIFKFLPARPSAKIQPSSVASSFWVTGAFQA